MLPGCQGKLSILKIFLHIIYSGHLSTEKFLVYEWFKSVGWSTDPVVVYFDQYVGAANSKHWPKSDFSMFFSLKS